MNIFITKQNNAERAIYFPEDVLHRLNRIGTVRLNDKPVPLTEAELKDQIRDVDICITHWASPPFTAEVLGNANRLKMIAHAGGSVANVTTEQVYRRGIKVISANNLMARYVAEGVLAYFLAGLKLIPEHCAEMKSGVAWNRRVTECKSLYQAKIGLIGLGTIGRYLLEFLKPFDVRVKLYDPYVSEDIPALYGNVETDAIEEVLKWGDIISVHASLTQETRHMLNAERLKLIRDGALFVNTARGAIVDEGALISELEKERFRAVLDVFENEPLELQSPLRKLNNAIILPHVAGSSGRERLTHFVIDDIERFVNGQPLKNEISLERFKLMTKE